MENMTNTMTMPINAVAPSTSTTPWHLSVSASVVATPAAPAAACVRVRGQRDAELVTTGHVGHEAVARIDAVDATFGGAFAGFGAAAAIVPGSRTWSPPPC